MKKILLVAFFLTSSQALGGTPAPVWNPQDYGVTGNATVYRASGTTGNTTVTCAIPATSGQAVIVRRGGASVTLPWAMPPTVWNTSNTVGTIIYNSPLTVPTNLANYSELVVPITFVPGQSCMAAIPNGGIKLIFYDGNNNVLTTSSIQYGVQSGSPLASFALDQTALTTTVASIGVRLDFLQSTTNVILSNAGYGVGTTIPNSGVGLTLAMGNPTACSSLLTTVVSNTNGILTLAAPLATTIPFVKTNMPALTPYGSEGILFDDAPAWKVCIAACPDTGRIEVPYNCCSPLGSNISLFSRDGVAIVGMGRVDNKGIGKSGASFLWMGPGGGTMFDGNCYRLGLLENLAFFGNGAAMPNIMINFDQKIVPGQTATTNCTRDTVRSCLFVGPVSNPNFTCIYNSATSQVNCEYHNIEDCVASVSSVWPGQGSFLINGGSPNAKGLHVTRCSISNAAVGVSLLYGSAFFDSLTGTYNTVFISVAGSTDPIVIEKCHPEINGGAGGCFVKIGLGINVTLRNNTDASELGSGIVYAGAASIVTIECNKFQNSQPTGVTAIPLLALGSNPASVTLRGNRLAGVVKNPINMWLDDGTGN